MIYYSLAPNGATSWREVWDTRLIHLTDIFLRIYHHSLPVFGRKTTFPIRTVRSSQSSLSPTAPDTVPLSCKLSAVVFTPQQQGDDKDAAVIFLSFLLLTLPLRWKKARLWALYSRHTGSTTAATTPLWTLMCVSETNLTNEVTDLLAHPVQELHGAPRPVLCRLLGVPPLRVSVSPVMRPGGHRSAVAVFAFHTTQRSLARFEPPTPPHTPLLSRTTPHIPPAFSCEAINPPTRITVLRRLRSDEPMVESNYFRGKHQINV